MGKKARRTLKDIKYYPTPKEIETRILKGAGWPYKTNMQFYRIRDQSLVALLYLLAARVSEVLRLKRNQFLFPDDSGLKDRILVRAIKLSKPRAKGKPRRHEYRSEAWLPLTGVRKGLTELIVDYLQLLKPEEQLFKFDRSMAWKITNALTGETNHFHRAYGEDYLYDVWDHDLLAVADYVKVDPRTLQEYIRKRYQKYHAV